MKAASIGFEMQKDLYTGSKNGRPSILAQQGQTLNSTCTGKSLILLDYNKINYRLVRLTDPFIVTSSRYNSCRKTAHDNTCIELNTLKQCFKLVTSFLMNPIRSSTFLIDWNSNSHH